MVETLFKTIKSELIWRTSFQSRHQAENAIARYIDGFYNPVRTHKVRDRDALLAFYDFPAEHWKHLRTTNPELFGKLGDDGLRKAAYRGW